MAAVSEYFSREAAVCRAYRWGEDGIAGISDTEQRLCLSLALWNGNDPFLKERFFGLTNREGNHGEDVKEVYYYLDAAQHDQLGDYRLFAEGSPELLFCDNETNVRRLCGQQETRGYFKDALHEYIVHGNHEAVNPGLTGTKAAAHYAFEVPAGGELEQAVLLL